MNQIHPSLNNMAQRTIKSFFAASFKPGPSTNQQGATTKSNENNPYSAHEQFAAKKNESKVVPSETVVLPIPTGYFDIGRVIKDGGDDQKAGILENNLDWIKDVKFPIRLEYGSRRQFSADWLSKYSWLRYSVSEDSVYCGPCALFAAQDPSNKEKNLITTPVTKWSNLGKYVQRHLDSKTHDGACVAADSFLKVFHGKQQSVLAQVDNRHAEEVGRNRHGLQAIIEVIILCGKQNIPLRSHDDTFSNFMVLLRDRASRDTLLKEYLESPKRVKYTSPEIQNTIISICEKYIRDKIVNKCNEAVCYSFLADEATDASTMEQIAMCVRFYSEADKEVREDFIGFIRAESTTGEALTAKFIEGQQTAGLDIMKMRGQGYDGASNMSGCHRGVQARIREQNPHAMYIHCKAHSLNLAIVHACKEALVRNMFDTVQHIAFAFNYSAKRILAFQDELENDNIAKEEMEKRTRLQNLCETRWASRADSLHTFKAAFSTIVSSLEVLEHEGDAKARSYRCSILRFDFIVSLVAVEFVMQGIVPLNNFLQKKDCDLVESANEAKVLIAQIRAERADDAVWDTLFDKAVDMAARHDVQPSVPRTTAMQQHRANVPAESVSGYWKRALYFPFMDHLAMELEDRLLTAHDRFLAQWLIPSNLGNMTAEIEDKIFDAYGHDFHGDREEFRREVARWKTRWSLSADKPSSLLKAVNLTNKDLYPSIYVCLVTLLTMPVSTATAERSFSVMRRIKNYLRSSMTSERLSGLAMLHSYRELHLNVAEIAGIFYGEGRNRKLDFI